MGDQHVAPIDTCGVVGINHEGRHGVLGREVYKLLYAPVHQQLGEILVLVYYTQAQKRVSLFVQPTIDQNGEFFNKGFHDKGPDRARDITSTPGRREEKFTAWMHLVRFLGESHVEELLGGQGCRSDHLCKRKLSVHTHK